MDQTIQSHRRIYKPPVRLIIERLAHISVPPLYCAQITRCSAGVHHNTLNEGYTIVWCNFHRIELIYNYSFCTLGFRTNYTSTEIQLLCPVSKEYPSISFCFCTFVLFVVPECCFTIYSCTLLKFTPLRFDKKYVNQGKVQHLPIRAFHPLDCSILSFSPSVSLSLSSHKSSISPCRMMPSL